MPTITLDGPPINDLDKKRALVHGITQAAAEYYNLPPETIVVFIKENSPDNVSVGGQLIKDRN